MILKKYIIEVLCLNERNMKKFFKKPLDYDLVIFSDINDVFDPHSAMKKIYSHFKADNSLWNNVLNIDFNSSKHSSFTKDSDVKDVMSALNNSNLSSIELKKNKEVLNILSNKFKFNFTNCDLSDNTPILCINPLVGDDSNLSKKKNTKTNLMNQIKDQTFRDIEEMNWFLHDEHHHKTQINTKNWKFINKEEIDEKGLANTNYDSSQTGYSYIDEGDINVSYLVKLIGLFLNEIGYTENVASNDIWASIYAYCINMMSKPEDAYSIDFSIVNKKGKNTLVPSFGSGINKNLQKMFYSFYENVHKYSRLSRNKTKKFADSKSNELKDGVIYIWCLTRY